MLESKLKELSNNLNDKNFSQNLTKMINLSKNKAYQEILYKVLYQNNWIANDISLDGNESKELSRNNSIIDKCHTYLLKSHGKKQRIIIVYSYIGNDILDKNKVKKLLSCMLKNIYHINKRIIKDFMIDFIVWIVFVIFMIGEAMYLKISDFKSGIITGETILIIENIIPMLFANVAIIFNNLRGYKKHLAEYIWAIVTFIICSVVLVLGLLALKAPI